MAVSKEELRLILSAKDQMSRTVKKNEKALLALKTAAKALGFAYVAMRLAKTVMAFARMGAEVERLNISFRRLAGAAPDEMLDQLRKTTRGTISDMGLMLNANRAMMLGVTKDAKTMARLTEIAIARGQALGLTAQTSMDRMVTGLGRMSVKILDDIGILTGGQKTFDDYAVSIGKTADELTDTEKRQALVNMVLRDNITLTDDAMSSHERLGSQLANLKNAAGSYIAGLLEGTGVVDVFAEGLQFMARTIERIGKSVPHLDRYKRALLEAFEAERITGLEAVVLDQEIDKLTEDFEGGIGTVRTWGLQVGALHPILAEVRVDIERINQVTDTWVTNWQRNITVLERVARVEEIVSAFRADAADAAEAYALSQMSLNEQYLHFADVLSQVTLGGKEFYEILLKLDSISKAMAAEKALSIKTFAAAGLRLALALRAENLEAQIRIWETEQRKHKENTVEWVRIETTLVGLKGQLRKQELQEGETYNEELRRLRRERLTELRSTVERLLQPTAVTELDMARTQLGKYTDKWDEYIRRVRSAATDAESAWKHLIPTDILAQGADAIKVWAAETERAFYAGMIPEAIDWEAFDRAFEQFMREKAGREAMIQEAMKRTGATQADIEFMLGYSGDVVQGASAAMKEIAATKGPIATVKNALPIFKKNLDIAGDAASALGIPSGPLDAMKSVVKGVNDMLAQFEDALEKAKKALEPPPPTEPTEPTEPTGAIDPITGETVTTAIGGGAVGHGATVVFAAGSVVVTGTGGPGATRRDTEVGMLAALRAAGMPI